MAQETTQTVVETVSNETAQETNDTLKISVPIFILFAEHLGYVSSLKKLVEEWTKGTPPPVPYQKLLRVEALSIRQQMIKDYEVDYIKTKYNELYPIFFGELEEKMDSILEDPSLYI